MSEIQNTPIVAVRGLTIGYPPNDPVQQDISFEVQPGEIFVILGGSGCGKSTLLKHLIGLRRPMSGKIELMGMDFNGVSEDKRQKLMRSFGVLYQSGALFGSMNVGQNIDIILAEYTTLTKSERDERILHLLTLVGLHEHRDKMPAELSGGMKKRAGLARALALDPKLLFLDEPSAGLDPISSANLDELILDLRKQLGTTIVIVTHELDSIFTVADRIIMLDREARTAIAVGNPHELREHSQDERVTAFLNRDGRKRETVKQPH